VETLAYLMAIVLAGALSVIALLRLVERVTIWEYEKGLRYHKGRLVETVEPGQYWIFRLTTRIVREDMRPRQTIIVGQEVLSADSVSLRLSVAARYEVVDPSAAINAAQDYREALYLIVQLAVRRIIGASPIDELVENRKSFDTMLQEQCEEQVGELGLKLLSVNVRDIMFPGDLKNVFAGVIKARKEGQAALEKARGETAALRNLANAATLMDNNPALLHLRAIQALEESRGNTLVLGVPSQDTLGALKSQNKVE